MSKATHLSGEITIRWTMEAPHDAVDTETIRLVILDALIARFSMIPRGSGPVFDLITEAMDTDILIDEDDRVEEPAEFRTDLRWYTESQM